MFIIDLLIFLDDKNILIGNIIKKQIYCWINDFFIFTLENRLDEFGHFKNMIVFVMKIRTFDDRIK